MGLGGILRGLTGAAEGAEQGLANRAELERQARMQLLAQRLQEAQIGHLTAETRRLQQPAAPPRIDPNSPAGIAAAIAKRAPPKGKAVLTPDEQRAHREVVRAAKIMRDLYRKDKTAAQTPVASAVATGLGKLPVVGGAISGLTGPAAQSAMTANQQAFQRAATQLRHHYAMISPHARTSLGLLHDINTAIVPPAGTDSSTIANAFAPQWDDIINSVGATTGDAEPTAPPPTTAPKARINPKFWKPRAP